MKTPTLFAALLLTSLAGAQNLNVDLGTDFAAPASAYGAAAGQAGHWTMVDGDLSSATLEDLTGASTGVQLFLVPGAGSAGDWSFDNPGTGGDDQALMDDFFDVGPEAFGAVAILTLTGVAPGEYDLYTYAWAPDDATYVTEIDVTASTEGPKYCSGSWPGGHVEGTTFLKHRITATGTSFDIVATSFSTGSYGTVNGFQLVSVDGQPIGTNYCSPANLNSTGQSAEIAASGSASVPANFVVLDATLLPPNQFGYFLNSQAQGFVANPGGSQGNLCLGGGIGRYSAFIDSTGAAGELSLALDLTMTPTPGGLVAIQPGETWNFQCWFRDKNPDNTSNFTDGVSILFQ